MNCPGCGASVNGAWALIPWENHHACLQADAMRPIWRELARIAEECVIEWGGVYSLDGYRFVTRLKELGRVPEEPKR